MKRLLTSFCVLLWMGIEVALAQAGYLKGVVISADDQQPVVGATVRVEGTDRGTITDIDGRYSVQARQGDKLRFSYVGMKTLVLKATQGMTVTLETEAELIDEVVVTGYGNVKKSAYTGAASVFNTDKQQDLPVISVTQMLEANLPGVSFSNNTGQPGANTSISIRGIGSLSASNEPLYVLDGVPVQSGNMSSNDMNSSGLGILSSLNPADIENVTILKDAASASLYGARGANGVVLITTKKGREGRTSYRLKASFGISDMAVDFRPTMGGEERRALIYEGFMNAYLGEADAEERATRETDYYASMPAGGWSDWEGALFRKALQQNYDFSVMGGNERTRFAGSLAYTNQENVFRNAGFERYSGRLNVNHSHGRMDFGMNAMFSLTKEDAIPGQAYYSNPMYALKTTLTPSIPIRNEDGSYNTNLPAVGNTNPVYENEINDHNSEVNRTFMSAEAGYRICKGLKISSVMNVDYTHTKEFRYFSPLSSDGLVNNGQGNAYSVDNLTYNWNSRLNYTGQWGGHSLDALLAYEVHRWDKEYLEAESKNYTTDKKHVLGNASEPTYIGHYKDGDSMLSYVARLNYDYAKKYYLSASFRRDGSSRLSPSNRWGNFWALSGSWRLSQEAFMKDTAGWLTDAKLRASYGVNGNVPNGLYSWMGQYDLSYSYNDQPAMVETNLANPTLSWEKNYALNLGFDLFLLNRINVSFDWYTRRTKDLLLSRNVNPVTGFGSITDNVGEVLNTGFEIELHSVNIDTKDFTWSTSFNISHNSNEVKKLADVSQYYSSSSSFIIVKEGYSLGTFYLREYAGVDPENGMPQYYSNREVDGVRSRELVNDPSQAVAVPLQDMYPTVSGGLMNTFRYKMFDLSFNLSYSLGGYSYDGSMWSLQDDGMDPSAPKSVELRRRWQKPGDVTDIPRYVYGQDWGGWWHSSRGIHSTDHLRLKSLILGANAPKAWLKRLGLSQARLYFSGTNLLTWAKYDQYDPELSGVVNYELPPLKSYSFGLEISF